MEFQTESNIEQLSIEDKRKQTSKANLAKARQAKLDKLKKEKELKAQIHQQGVPDLYGRSGKTSMPQTRINPIEESDSESEEEILYFNPPSTPINIPQPATQPQSNNELNEIKFMLQQMMAQGKVKKPKKTKESVIYVQQPVQPIQQPQPIQAPIEQPKPKNEVATEMKRKLLNF